MTLKLILNSNPVESRSSTTTIQVAQLEVFECSTKDIHHYRALRNIWKRLDKLNLARFELKISFHDDVIQWKHFPHYWPFVRGIHRSPVNSSHKGKWRGALMFSLTCALNKRFSKQSWDWWFDKPSRPLWCHCNTERYPLYSAVTSPTFRVHTLIIYKTHGISMPNIWCQYMHRIDHRKYCRYIFAQI